MMKISENIHSRERQWAMLFYNGYLEHIRAEEITASLFQKVPYLAKHDFSCNIIAF